MKIAQVAPIWERVPPPMYGGTQRIVHSLTEGLVKIGHDVTLFATGDSITTGRLESIYPRALYRDNISWENHIYPMLHYINAFEQGSKFDLIHCHIDRHTEYIAFSLAERFPVPVVFTLHFILPSVPQRVDRRQFLTKFKNLNFISISDSQRQPMPELNFIGTVYNGINLSEIKYQSSAGDNLVWLGRINRTKGTKEAIEIANLSNKKLILAGKIDKLDQEDYRYFKEEIEPKIDNNKVRYIGEVDARVRNKLFSDALALLNPIQWEEPFGLVPVEAQAAGLPVIAFKRGAMPEVIDHGQTGFLVETITEAVDAVSRISKINRLECRKWVERKFSEKKMVENYERAYQTLIRNSDGTVKRTHTVKNQKSNLGQELA